MTFQAYAREIDYWKHLDHDFIALGHANLNVARLRAYRHCLRAPDKPETRLQPKTVSLSPTVDQKSLNPKLACASERTLKQLVSPKA